MLRMCQGCATAGLGLKAAIAAQVQLFSGPILGPFPSSWSFEERRIPPGPCVETLLPMGTGIWVHTHVRRYFWATIGSH